MVSLEEVQTFMDPYKDIKDEDDLDAQAKEKAEMVSALQASSHFVDTEQTVLAHLKPGQVPIPIPNFQIKIMEIGSFLSRLKIFVSFAQCLSYYRVVFSGVPWPAQLLVLMSALDLSGLDLFDLGAVFGNVGCVIQTSFLTKFTLHILLVPILCGAVALAYGVALLRRPRKQQLLDAHRMYTGESMRVRVYSILNFTAFGQFFKRFSVCSE